jgi:hypothetical protein
LNIHLYAASTDSEFLAWDSGFFDGKIGVLGGLVQNIFMEDSENRGKGEMQERNRTVVYLRAR